MSKQSFSADEREAILQAHSYKCSYTNKNIDESIFHIDHVIPEILIEKPDELACILNELELPKDFDLLGWGNLLPCHPDANLRKSKNIFNLKNARYYLNMAENKKPDIIKHLEVIKRRKNRGRVVNLLQQSLERGELTTKEVARILENFNEAPEAISEHLQGLKFADTKEAIDVSNINLDVLLHALRDQLIRVGSNAHLDKFTLANDGSEHKILEWEEKRKNKDYLCLYAENINRHRMIFSNIMDIDYFHLYRNESEKHSILCGVGPFYISVKDRCIDIDFNNSYYQPRLNEKFQYVDLLCLPIKEIIDFVVYSIGYDETIQSFGVTFDFSPNPLNEIYFSLKTNTCNIDPNKYGYSSSGVYTVENDELMNDIGMRVPPSRESNYLKIIVASYNIYRKILKHKAD
ncbi:HNH endonuclease [Pectobacterium versatile]|uniref:HNH endonuclease n=1 Tax=Pectobacterium versatile TaxID=2488639 RepID=UPI00102EB7CF|nr:hypothetical protein [Pectobacterium versatile]TAI88885.1 hypothetical protein EG330_01355 [Pectobacterium versatile]